MAKKNALIGVTFENGTLRFNVGEAGSIDLVVAELAEGVRERATLHGLVQKVSDAAAMPKSELTGDAKKDAKTKLAAMRSVADRLIAGDWSKRAGEGAGPVAGIIFRAFEEFVEVSAKSKKQPVPDAEKIRSVYDAKSRSEQLALRNVPEIAAIIERMKSERGGDVAKVDTSALLSELGL